MELIARSKINVNTFERPTKIALLMQTFVLSTGLELPFFPSLHQNLRLLVNKVNLIHAVSLLWMSFHFDILFNGEYFNGRYPAAKFNKIFDGNMINSCIRIDMGTLLEVDLAQSFQFNHKIVWPKCKLSFADANNVTAF